MKKKDFRVESDSMGDVLVPEDAFYGAQTQRAVDNFTIFDQPLPWTFLEAVLLIKTVAAETNCQLGILSEEYKNVICEVVDELLSSQPLQQFPVSVYQTGSGTSTNMNVNEVIAGMALQRGVSLSPNDHVNLGQSSNDVIPAAIHIASTLSTSRDLLPALCSLSSSIREFSLKNKEIIKTARTHLMDALPMYLHAELEAWSIQLDECTERISEALRRIQRLPLGGTAIGSGLNCHPLFAAKATALLSNKTGLSFTEAPSKYKGLSSLDTVVELSGHLKTSAVTLSKIANDLRWMNSGPLAGLAEIQLPALQPGSSIMPAKINPVIPEAVCMAMAQVIGNDTTISIAGLGGNFQLNTMLPVTAANILYSIDLITGSAKALRKKTITGMKVNHKVFDQALSLNPILVTALNPIIGYLKAAEIGKIALRDGRTVLDVAREQTDIPETDLKKILDPKKLADGNKV